MVSLHMSCVWVSYIQISGINCLDCRMFLSYNKLIIHEEKLKNGCSALLLCYNLLHACHLKLFKLICHFSQVFSTLPSYTLKQCLSTTLAEAATPFVTFRYNCLLLRDFRARGENIPWGPNSVSYEMRCWGLCAEHMIPSDKSTLCSLIHLFFYVFWVARPVLIGSKCTTVWRETGKNKSLASTLGIFRLTV